MASRLKKFKAGDQVRVLGDERRFGHDWPAGTVITLERYDGSDDSWYGRPGPPEEAAETPGNWVGQTEIEELIPTEELDKQAAALFGIAAPANHCPTCTCRA